jgi:hypothetical protein
MSVTLKDAKRRAKNAHEAGREVGEAGRPGYLPVWLSVVLVAIILEDSQLGKVYDYTEVSKLVC